MSGRESFGRTKANFQRFLQEDLFDYRKNNLQGSPQEDLFVFRKAIFISLFRWAFSITHASFVKRERERGVLSKSADTFYCFCLTTVLMLCWIIRLILSNDSDIVMIIMIVWDPEKIFGALLTWPMWLFKSSQNGRYCDKAEPHMQQIGVKYKGASKARP